MSVFFCFYILNKLSILINSHSFFSFDCGAANNVVAVLLVLSVKVWLVDKQIRIVKNTRTITFGLIGTSSICNEISIIYVSGISP